MRFLIVTLTICTLLTSGCVEFFEKEIEIDALPYERQLILNSILSPQDSLIRVDVFVTAPAVGTPPSDYPINGMVGDAQVTLIGPMGNLAVEPPQTGRRGTYLLPQTIAALEASETYEIIAEWDGLTARGQVTVPELTILRDSILLEEVMEQDGDRSVLVRWPNQPGEQDYYLLFADETFRRGGNRPTVTQRVLYDFIHGRDALGPFISSELGIVSDVENTLNICQTTQTTYDYLLTRSTLDVNEDNPFAEPTTVANNLEEGLGLVGAINCWQFDF